MLLLDEELRCQPWSQCSVDWVRGSFDDVVLVGHFKNKNKIRKLSENSAIEQGLRMSCIICALFCKCITQITLPLTALWKVRLLENVLDDIDLPLRRL